MLSIVLVALASGLAAGPVNWHEDAFFGLHYDLHPNDKDTELGRETTYEHIKEQLEKCKPDYVQYDCKGHPGYAGYPTKVGSPSPGIVNDALKVWRQVTKDMGIPLSIHFSGVWDTRAIELHPDWARVAADGKPSPNNTCPTSGYTVELLIPQLLEVVELYDIDGVWIDGENWASQPCFCPRCAAEFTKRTGIQVAPKSKDDPEWFKYLAYQRDLFTEHVTKYAEALHAKKPALTVISNWMYSVRQPEAINAPVDALSGDFDPSFGAARACAEARFLSSRGLPWDLMAWSFLQTGEQGWTSKPAVHLCQEVAEVLAQGGAVFIYDQPQRSGRLTSWHQDVLADVGKFCQKRKAYSHKTKTIPQVAVLHSQSYYYRHNDPLFNFASGNQPMEGALHAALENGFSVDILNEEMFIERGAQYPVVIVPEQDGLPDPVKVALKTYVENGGRLLLSGTDASKDFPELTGVEATEGQQGGWFPADGGAVTLIDGWRQVKPGAAEELAALLSQQDPELNKTGFSAATRLRVGKGTVVTVHGPLFREYYRSHYPRLRSFVGEMISALDASQLMRMEGPWWVEMAARQKDGRTLIQLVNRSASGYLAPDRHMVEHVPDAGAFTVRIPMAKAPTRCYLAPDEAGLEWTFKDGVLTAKIAGLAIHNVLVVE